MGWQSIARRIDNFSFVSCRRCQNDVADHQAAFQEFISLDGFRDRKLFRDDRFDLAFFQQFKERDPVFLEWASVESRNACFIVFSGASVRRQVEQDDLESFCARLLPSHSLPSHSLDVSPPRVIL